MMMMMSLEQNSLKKIPKNQQVYRRFLSCGKATPPSLWLHVFLYNFWYASEMEWYDYSGPMAESPQLPSGPLELNSWVNPRLFRLSKG